MHENHDAAIHQPHDTEEEEAPGPSPKPRHTIALRCLGAAALMIYAIHGVAVGDLYVPGKSTPGVHFSGAYAAVMALAATCAALALACDAVDWSATVASAVAATVRRRAAVTGWALFVFAIAAHRFALLQSWPAAGGAHVVAFAFATWVSYIVGSLCTDLVGLRQREADGSYDPSSCARWLLIALAGMVLLFWGMSWLSLHVDAHPRKGIGALLALAGAIVLWRAAWEARQPRD